MLNLQESLAQKRRKVKISMEIKAHAKINLSLDIVGKRSDGYHELDTLFYELSLHDLLIVEKQEKEGIFLNCSDETLSCSQDNLIYKAVKLLQEKYQIKKGVRIYLEKNIPMGAGLGGGSSDAAAALKAVNELFNLNIPRENLKEFGAKLGADVPFFIEGGMARAQGIGEQLTPLKKKKLWPMIVIKPEVSVPTVWAYKEADKVENPLHPDIKTLLKSLEEENYSQVCESLGNSFEKAVCSQYPQIEEVKKELLFYGADVSVMTGSGAAVFALFDNAERAEKAADQLEKKHKEWKIFRELGD